MPIMTLQEQYDDALLALHNLQTGKLPRVVVDMNGERVEFGAARKADLDAYVKQLAAQLGIVSLLPNLRPAQFFF